MHSISKTPKTHINQSVYYFLVRCRTFTMQTLYVCQHTFFLAAVTQKTRLSGYLEPKQGEANLNLHLIYKLRTHFPNTGTPQDQRTWRDWRTQLSSSLAPTALQSACMAQELYLYSQVFLLLPPLILTVRF